MKLENMKRSEDTEQAKVICWAESNRHRYPELKWLHHIPNGGSRKATEATKLKQMGVKRGISDLHLPFPHGKYHGLYIEMKFGRNTLTKEQTEFLCDMCDAGHFTAVCYDAQSAEKLIGKYMDLPDKTILYTDELEDTDVSHDKQGIAHIRSASPFA